jgi:Cft2 family RNA processing exonuclease
MYPSSAASGAPSSSFSLSSSSSKVAVTLTPIVGDGKRFTSSLLTIGSARILLDCGWTEEFDAADLEPLRAVLNGGGAGGAGASEGGEDPSHSSSSPAPGLDAVLISQPTLAHCGGLPYLYGALGCRAPCYMTPPAQRLGQLAVFDAFLSATNADTGAGAGAGAASAPAGSGGSALANPVTSITLEDIKACFEVDSYGGPVATLRYLEESTLQGGRRGAGGYGYVGGGRLVTISPSASGFALGGAVWRISMGTETVLYAPTFNHRNEKVLAKTLIPTLFKSPSALITTPALPAAAAAGGGEGGMAPPAGDASVDAVGRQLADLCLSSLRMGGHVLLPCDSTGRVLEVLARLDAAFGLATPYPIIFLSRVAQNVLEGAKTAVEYMSEKVVRSFTDTRVVPFDFRPERSRVRTASSLAEVTAMAAWTPVVVVTPLPSLSVGFARELFALWAGDARNTVLFTSRDGIAPTSVAAQLLGGGAAASGQSSSAFSVAAPSSITLESYTVVPLVGLELKRHKDAQEEEKRRAARAVATARLRSEEEAELAEAGLAVVRVAPSSTATTTAGAALTPSASHAGGGAGMSLEEEGVPLSPVPVIAHGRASGEGAADAGMRAAATDAVGDDGRIAEDEDEEEEEDDAYTDDGDTVSRLEFPDDALAVGRPRGGGGGRGGNGTGPGSGRGAVARFPMFGRDEVFSHAAARAVAHAAAASRGGSGAAAQAASEAAEAFTSFRPVMTDYGYSVNPHEFEEADSERVAHGSGLAHGTLLPIHLGLPAAIAAHSQFGGGPPPPRPSSPRSASRPASPSASRAPSATCRSREGATSPLSSTCSRQSARSASSSSLAHLLLLLLPPPPLTRRLRSPAPPFASAAPSTCPWSVTFSTSAPTPRSSHCASAAASSPPCPSSPSGGMRSPSCRPRSSPPRTSTRPPRRPRGARPGPRTASE